MTIPITFWNDREPLEIEADDLRSAVVKAVSVGASLVGARLDGAHLDGANLVGANLDGASLSGSTTLPPFQIVPDEGAFIGYKKVRDVDYQDVVLTLEIQADAQRASSLIGRKCRASAVKVLKAEYKDGSTPPDGTSFHSTHDHDFTYRVGETVSVPDFNDDIRIECTHGIHFFITKKEAIEY